LQNISEQTVDYYRKVALDYDSFFLSPMHTIMDREEKEGVGRWVKGSHLVLDVGCGTGRMTSFLKSAGYDVVGIDISRSMLDVAKSRVPGTDLIQATANALPFADKSFDANVSIWGCLCHVDDPYFAIKEIVRVTKKRLIFSIYGNIAYKVLLRITAVIRSPQNALRYAQGGGNPQLPAKYYPLGQFLLNLPKNLKLVDYSGLNFVPMLLPNSVGKGSNLIQLFQNLDRIMLRIPLVRSCASVFLVVADII
jgi:SAM-dependent methyltransferase